MIEVKNLSKEFKVHVKSPGFKSSFGSLFSREYKTVNAVQNINFKIEPGEIVGFLGPNGSGKTTTLKMLCGLIHPSQGEISVAGHIPKSRDPRFLRQITLVMGQKQQLLWDLTPGDSFLVNQAIYEISDVEFKKRIQDLCNALDIKGLLNKPIRKLSLGERMKCEIVAALLHQPKILFLDEPTLGLDINTQKLMRQFILDYQKRNDTTILITSHYMADITETTNRVIMIHHGEIIYDGKLDALSQKVHPYKLIKFTLGEKFLENDLLMFGKILKFDGFKGELLVDKDQSMTLASQLLNRFPLRDFNIEDVPIEQSIQQFLDERNP